MSAVKWVSGHDNTIAHLNSQKLWLYTAYLCEIKAAEIPAESEKELWTPFTNWGTIVNWWLLREGETILFRDVAPEWLPLLFADGPTSLPFKEALYFLRIT